MRVQVVLVCLVLLAVLASLSDASLISASGRRRARSILQPSAQAVLRNQVQAKHGSNFAASSSTSVTDLVSDAEKALLVARVNVDKAFEAARAAQLERGAKRNAIIAFADNDLKVAKRAVIDAQLDLEASRRIQQAQVNAKADQDPNVIAARKAFESARAKKVMQPSNKVLVADFEATKQRWTLAVIAARVAIRFPAAAPKPAPVPAAPAKTAYAPAQQKTAAVPNAGKTGLPAGASPSSAAAAAPASGSAAAGTASATAAADPYAESLRNQRANNPLNQMHGGIEYVASELDQGMRASMIKDGMNPDGPVGVTCRAIPNFFWRAITSVGTAIGKISLSSHNAAEASHAGKSGSSIAKTFVTEAGPAAVQLAVTGASLGAAAGAESAVGYLVQTTQGLATEAGTKLIVQALPANSGAATAVSAISAAASNSLLSLSSSAGAGTAASEVLALTNKFKTSGFARVSLALLLSTYRGVNLGANVNAALNQIGLPPTPQSPVDVARTFIRVKYSSGTITVDEWKLAESMLDVPRFQKVVGDAFERAARMSSDALKATPKK